MEIIITLILVAGIGSIVVVLVILYSSGVKQDETEGMIYTEAWCKMDMIYFSVTPANLIDEVEQEKIKAESILKNYIKERKRIRRMKK